MPELNFNCSVYQGFNFKKDIQDHVGHITALKIGDKDFSADLKVSNPCEVTVTVPVVGVLSGVQWSTGHAEPIFMGFQVSIDNKTKASLLLHQDLADTSVAFSFAVYEFDPKQKKYFKCFHTEDAALNGLVFKRGGDLDLYISTEQSREIESPKNFSMSIGIMPPDKAQALQVAVSETDKFAKPWGVEVSA